ncbi:MAG: hypothetical protein WD872_19000 [Pirellulaceae bacterium]
MRTLLSVCLFVIAASPVEAQQKFAIEIDDVFQATREVLVTTSVGGVADLIALEEARSDDGNDGAIPFNLSLTAGVTCMFKGGAVKVKDIQRRQRLGGRVISYAECQLLLDGAVISAKPHTYYIPLSILRDHFRRQG